jgi:transposase-like protein
MSSTRRSKRRSAADWSALVEACKRSGLSRSEFAIQEGLHRGTFGYWASRLAPKRGAKRSTATAPKPTFEPVRVRRAEEHRAGEHVTRAPSKAQGVDKVEVVLANGRRVRCNLSQVEDPRLAVLITLADEVRRC